MPHPVHTTHPVHPVQSTASQSSHSVSAHSSHSVSADSVVSTHLSQLNEKLPKGIIADVLWNKHTPSLRYSVRFMQDGKRVNLGQFMTLDGAVTAMVEYKYKKLNVISQAELDRREEQMRHDVFSVMQSAFTSRAEVALGELEQNPAVSGVVSNYTVMADIYKELPLAKIAATRAFDWWWEQGDKLVSVTPKMIKDYEDFLGQAVVAGTASEDSNVGSSGENAESGESENVEGESLSDEEYDKLLGLDD